MRQDLSSALIMINKMNAKSRAQDEQTEGELRKIKEFQTTEYKQTKDALDRLKTIQMNTNAKLDYFARDTSRDHSRINDLVESVDLLVKKASTPVRPRPILTSTPNRPMGSINPGLAD